MHRLGYRAPDVAVISAGVKSILDIGLTLETMETLGVPVISYGTDEFPAFFSRHSGFAAPMRSDSPTELADDGQPHAPGAGERLQRRDRDEQHRCHPARSRGSDGHDQAYGRGVRPLVLRQSSHLLGHDRAPARRRDPECRLGRRRNAAPRLATQAISRDRGSSGTGSGNPFAERHLCRSARGVGSDTLVVTVPPATITVDDVTKGDLSIARRVPSSCRDQTPAPTRSGSYRW